IAGHIGHAKRFEYTVIGDPVNEAARLTTLAKMEQGHVLASAATIHRADAPEAARWVLGRSVELRGRGIMTQLARPLRATLADRWQAGAVALRPAEDQALCPRASAARGGRLLGRRLAGRRLLRGGLLRRRLGPPLRE